MLGIRMEMRSKAIAGILAIVLRQTSSHMCPTTLKERAVTGVRWMRVLRHALDRTGQVHAHRKVSIVADAGARRLLRIGVGLWVGQRPRQPRRNFFWNLLALYESRSERSSGRRSRIRLLSAPMIASARSRLVFCSSSTFSSTVSRAISR